MLEPQRFIPATPPAPQEDPQTPPVGSFSPITKPMCVHLRLHPLRQALSVDELCLRTTSRSLEQIVDRSAFLRTAGGNLPPARGGSRGTARGADARREVTALESFRGLAERNSQLPRSELGLVLQLSAFHLMVKHPKLGMSEALQISPEAMRCSGRRRPCGSTSRRSTGKRLPRLADPHGMRFYCAGGRSGKVRPIYVVVRDVRCKDAELRWDVEV